MTIRFYIELMLVVILLIEVNISLSQQIEYQRLDSLADHFSDFDLDQSLAFRKQALEVAQSTEIISGIYKSLNEIAAAKTLQGQYHEAINDFTDALKYASDLSDTIDTYAEMSVAHRALGDNDKAVRILLDGLQQTEGETGDLRIKVLNKLGLFYRDIKETEKAIRYFRQIPGEMVAAGSRRLQLPYINISLIYLDEGAFDSAIFYLEKAFPYLEEQNDTYGLALYHNNLGTIYNDRGDPKEALPHALKAIELKKEMGLTNSLANSYNLLTGIYLGLENFEQAEVQALEALAIQDSSAVNNVKYNTLRYLIEAKLKSKDLSEISELVDELRALNVKRFEQERAEGIAAAEAQYEVAQKEAQLRLQEVEIAQKAAQRNVLIGGVLALIFVTLLIYRSQRIKVKANKELADKNNQIKDLESLKTRWFTNIAHELRTPLTLVGGPIDKVLGDENVNVVGKEDLLLASKNVKQLQHTISEILDISRLEEGQLVIDSKPTDISSLARSAVAAFDSLAKRRKISLINRIEEKVFAKVDESKINKVLLNLLMNAFKYTQKDGTIKLSLEVDEDIVIKVSDTGSGISSEDLPHVFDRFFQTKDQTKALEGGTGVGLSLTKEIVNLHGGDISVVSEPFQKTAFTVRLPKKLLSDSFVVKPNADLGFEAEPEISSPILPTGKPSLLLVEDNTDMRQFIRGLLRSDYQLLEAENGLEGLSLLEEFDVDLIISDVMMPGMDGITFAKKVKQHKMWKELPFITITALANEEDKVYTLQIGVDDYLYKPFNPTELKVRVKNLLANHQERKAAEPEPGFDDAVVQKLQKLVSEKITDSNLSIADLAHEANMSDRNLRRYLKKLTGLSPIQFIQEVRLMKALTFLENKKYKTLSEVSNAIGIGRTSHFSALFERRFGKRPADYLI